MKKIFILILVSHFAISVSAHEQCEVPLNSAPGIYNIRLGMSGSEAKHAAGGRLNIKNKKEGVFFQNYIKKSPPANLPGLRVLYLRFFDSKIYQIEVFYEYGERETSEFVRSFSLKSNLNFDWWTIKNGIAKLECDGFSIVSDNYLNPRIEITDTKLFSDFKASQKK